MLCGPWTLGSWPLGRGGAPPPRSVSLWTLFGATGEDARHLEHFNIFSEKHGGQSSSTAGSHRSGLMPASARPMALRIRKTVHCCSQDDRPERPHICCVNGWRDIPCRADVIRYGRLSASPADTPCPWCKQPGADWDHCVWHCPSIGRPTSLVVPSDTLQRRLGWPALKDSRYDTAVIDWMADVRSLLVDLYLEKKPRGSRT